MAATETNKVLARKIIGRIMPIIRSAKRSGFSYQPDIRESIEALAEALEGEVMDTYETAALQIMAVLRLIPQDE